MLGVFGLTGAAHSRDRKYRSPLTEEDDVVYDSRQLAKSRSLAPSQSRSRNRGGQSGRFWPVLSRFCLWFCAGSEDGSGAEPAPKPSFDSDPPGSEKCLFPSVNLGSGFGSHFNWQGHKFPHIPTCI